jgi:hypothetical protein
MGDALTARHFHDALAHGIVRTAVTASAAAMRRAGIAAICTVAAAAAAVPASIAMYVLVTLIRTLAESD